MSRGTAHTAEDYRVEARRCLAESEKGGPTMRNLWRLLRGVLCALLALGGDD